MKLSEELKWRGYVHQTTLKDLKSLDNKTIKFYLGVDPSSDSMTIGNLAALKLASCLIRHGHQGYLLVGGATGMIGDPDGKKQERDLLSVEDITANKQKLENQFKNLFPKNKTDVVDNYDWFKDIGYLDFLRDIGKNVPLSQMLGRDFVSTRLKDENAGLSYAEFSYALIQAYDFLHLYKVKNVTLQICGSDQWGNSVAGVDLIRRKTGGESHVLSMPLVINQQTGVKFGKTESGAIWLDPNKTTPTQFYQFWVNIDDASVESYLKIFTDLDEQAIDKTVDEHKKDLSKRVAQKRLAEEVTTWVHGSNSAKTAQEVTSYLVGENNVGEANNHNYEALAQEIPVVKTNSVIEALVKSKLASSNTEARRLLAGNAIALNGTKISQDKIEDSDFTNGRLIIRKGKAFKDSAIIEKT